MRLKIKLIINLFFLILITNTNFLQAHNFLNGGCKNHCEETIKTLTTENELNYNSIKNQIEDNESCLSKSLCRG